MNLWQKIKQRVNPRNKADPKHISGHSFKLSNLLNSFFGSKEHVLATNEAIFSVITRLANVLASLPLKELAKYKEINDSISSLITVSPNPNMSAFEFINKLETDRNKDGNGYALIERDQFNQPVNLVPLPAINVEPLLNEDDNSIWYHLMLKNDNFYVSAFNMIHVKHITGAGRYVGISPIDVLKGRGTLEFDEAIQKFSLHEMNKIDGFSVEYGANVSDEKREQVIDSIKTYINESGGVLFNEPGVNISKIDRDFQTADVADTDAITNKRIANAFNVPLQFVNEAVSGSFSSNEQLMTQFVQMTLAPIVRQYEQEFNRKLLTDADRRQGKYFKFNMNGLMRGDVQARTQYYQQMRRSGVFTTNDILRLEDMPISNDENADRLFVSGDLYPMDMDPAQRKGVSTNETTKPKDDTDQEVLADEDDDQ